MEQADRQEVINRICNYYDNDASAVERAARERGALSSMFSKDVEADSKALEDEVIRHMQVEQAVRLSMPIHV